MLESKDILEAIGFDGEPADADAIVAHINTRFIARDRVQDDPDIRRSFEGRLFGESYGALANASGGKLKKSELEKLTYKEALQTFSQTLAAEIESVQTKAKEGKSKRESELEAQLTDFQKSIQDYQRDTQAAKDYAAQIEADSSSKVRGYVVGMRRKEVESKMPWKDGLTEIERTGLETFIASNYQFDADESGGVQVKDKQGHTIPHSKKAGEVKDLEDIYTEVGEKYGLFKKSNATEQRQPPRRHTTDNNSTATPRRLPLIG